MIEEKEGHYSIPSTWHIELINFCRTVGSPLLSHVHTLSHSAEGICCAVASPDSKILLLNEKSLGRIPKH